MDNSWRSLSRIRHRHLWCFIEIARCGKISAAAEAMNVSQPAASKTLRELEELLETRLFRRGGKGGLSLTPAGQLFQRYAGASIAALKEGVDGLAQARKRGELAVTVGALPVVAVRVMPDAVRAFRRSHGAQVRIITRPNSSLLSQLRLGELDLVIGRMARPKEMLGLSFTHLYSEHVVLVVRAGHPLPANEPFNVTDLESMTVLLPTREGIMRPVIDRFLIANGVGLLPDRIEARSPDFCRQYALTSDAVWIVSEGVADPDLKSGALRRLDVDTTDTRGAVGLTTRADIAPSPTVRLFMDTVAEVTAGLRTAHEAGDVH